jgi:hypothetical protein
MAWELRIKCTGQIDGAQLQPAKAGFVMQAEGFSPAGDVQHLIDQYRIEN